MKIIESNIRQQFFRFIELYEHYTNDKHGRTLVLPAAESENPDNIIRWACSNGRMPTLWMNGSTGDWTVIFGGPMLKTMFDFYENKFSVDGELYKDMPGWQRRRFEWLEMHGFVVNPDRDNDPDIDLIIFNLK